MPDRIPVILVLGLVAVTSLPIDARSLDVAKFSRLKEKAPSLAPYPFIKLCRDHPDQCVKKTGPSRVLLDSSTLRRLETINAEVNHAIRPRREPPGADKWMLDTNEGDCEEYALAKRQLLLDSGLPPKAIRLAVGTTRRGEPHAVVVVKTDRGDIALDNRSEKPRSVAMLDLDLTKIESAENPKLWRAL